MSRLSYLAPAKLNLFLHVVGRRSDGFHELQTVFQLVDLCDELRIELRRDGRIVREPAPTGMLASLSDDADLSVRAARLLQKISGTPSGADIHVKKRIPAGGGLGGGSSDAATVLLALNQLWGLDWPRDRLAALGAELGSDVPVFVHGRSAWAEGRGEKLCPVDLPQRWFLIIDPGAAVSTAGIFAAADLTRDTAPIKICAIPADGGRNDCEAVVRARYPAVAAALDWLKTRGGGRLTGTGGCVFAGFEDEVRARALLEELPAQWSGFVARGLSHSPPFDLID
jgi:4-diphosphocytidyl-2-C-methyl-D-erythritol kinase